MLNASYRAFGQTRESTPFTQNYYAAQMNQLVNTGSNPTFVNSWYTDAWDDMITSVNPVASQIAPSIVKYADNAVGSTGVWGYGFDEGKTQDISVSTQMSHRYKVGSDLYPHIHLSVPTHEAVNFIQFGLEYFIDNIGSAYTVTTTINTASLACPNAKTHVVLPLPTIAGAGIDISSIFYGRLVRNTIANDYTGAVNVLSFDLHYMVDSVGSHAQYVK